MHNDELEIKVRDLRTVADLGLADFSDLEAAGNVKAKFLRLAGDENPGHERASNRIERRSARAARGRTSRRTALLSLGFLTVAGTAVAATAPWAPTVGNSETGHPTVATTAIPADQLATLGVLRRPQNEQDRGASIQAMLKAFSAREMAGVHTDSVRLLQRTNTGMLALVSLDRTGVHDAGYPSSEQHNVVCYVVSDDQTKLKGLGTSYSQRCGTSSEVKAGRLIGGATWDGRIGVAGLAPDGVSRVAIPLSTGRTLSAEVVNNSFNIEGEVSQDERLNLSQVQFLDSNNRPVIK